MTADFLFVSDDHYADNLGVCTFSVLYHMCPEADRVRLFVMDCGISARNRERLRRQTSRFPEAEIIFFDITDRLEAIAPRVPTKWNRAIYGRLFLSELPAEYPDLQRVVYLDCDLLMDRPVAELFTMPMNGKCVAGAADVESEGRKKALGITVSHNYVNSGVLLIDVQEWLRLDASRRIIDYINSVPDELVYPDQDAINYVLQDEIFVLRPEYNMMWMLRRPELPRMARWMESFAFPEEDLLYAHYRGKIYHFAGKNMWEFYGISPIFASVFKKYRRMSDWKGTRRHFGSFRNFVLWTLVRGKAFVTGERDLHFRRLENRKPDPREFDK